MSQTTRILQISIYNKVGSISTGVSRGSGVFTAINNASTLTPSASKSISCCARFYHNNGIRPGLHRQLLHNAKQPQSLCKNVESRIRWPQCGSSSARPTPRSKSTRWSSSSSYMNRSTRRSKSTLLHQNYARTKSTFKSKSKRKNRRRGDRPSLTQFLQALRKNINMILLQPRTIPIPRFITTRSISFTLSSCFGHASFVLVAASYFSEDFLLLRIMAVAGSTSMLVFTYFHPHGRVLWLPFQWNVLFIGINSYRIGRTLYYNNMGNRLSEEMKEIKRDILDVMDMFDYAKFVSIATEETFAEGELLQQQGQANPYVRLVIEGEMDCYRDGIKTYSLEKGNFVSEAGLHAGLLLDGTIESCCTIVANNKYKTTRCLRWNRTELVELLQRESGVKRSLKAALSWDIVRKLKGQRESITEHKVSDPEMWTRKRKEQSEDRYAAILHNLLTKSSQSRDKEEVQKRERELHHYRTIHHIDDEHHELALKKIGWTLEEYAVGKKSTVQQ